MCEDTNREAEVQVGSTDVFTEGVQGTTWQAERVCTGVDFLGYDERSIASSLRVQRENFYFPCPIQT